MECLSFCEWYRTLNIPCQSSRPELFFSALYSVDFNRKLFFGILFIKRSISPSHSLLSLTRSPPIPVLSLLLCVDIPFQNYCDLSDAARRYWVAQKEAVRHTGLLGICNELIGEGVGEGDMRGVISEEKKSDFQ
jgi:hypothetical protein